MSYSNTYDGYRQFDKQKKHESRKFQSQNKAVA